MEAGITRSGRVGLALITVAALIFAMLAISSWDPARADHEPPDDTYESVPSDGSNEADFWDTYFGLPEGSCSKINQSAGTAFVMPDPPDGEQWYALVVKQGSPSSNDGPDNFIYLDPVAGHSYPSAGNQAPGYSHLIVCSVPEVEDTTTTTVEDTTTTTVEDTTTTVEDTTTTVEDTTTTVEDTTTTVQVLETTITAGDTTTSSIEDEVLDEEILPFTGSESGPLAIVASILALLGSLLVWSARRAES